MESNHGFGKHTLGLMLVPWKFRNLTKKQRSSSNTLSEWANSRLSAFMAWHSDITFWTWDDVQRTLYGCWSWRARVCSSNFFKLDFGGHNLRHDLVTRNLNVQSKKRREFRPTLWQARDRADRPEMQWVIIVTTVTSFRLCFHRFLDEPDITYFTGKQSRLLYILWLM